MGAARANRRSRMFTVKVAAVTLVVGVALGLYAKDKLMAALAALGKKEI